MLRSTVHALDGFLNFATPAPLCYVAVPDFENYLDQLRVFLARWISTLQELSAEFDFRRELFANACMPFWTVCPHVA